MSTQPFSSRRPGISVTRRIASGPSAVKANGSPKRRNDGKTRQGNRGEVARAADAWAVQRSAAQGDRAALQRRGRRHQGRRHAHSKPGLQDVSLAGSADRTPAPQLALSRRKDERTPRTRASELLRLLPRFWAAQG